MTIDELKNTDETKRPDADRDTELRDLAAKKVGPNEEEKVKGGMQRQAIIETGLSN